MTAPFVYAVLEERISHRRAVYAHLQKTTAYERDQAEAPTYCALLTLPDSPAIGHITPLFASEREARQCAAQWCELNGWRLEWVHPLDMPKDCKAREWRRIGWTL